MQDYTRNLANLQQLGCIRWWLNLSLYVHFLLGERDDKTRLLAGNATSGIEFLGIPFRHSHLNVLNPKTSCLALTPFLVIRCIIHTRKTLSGCFYFI